MSQVYTFGRLSPQQRACPWSNPEEKPIISLEGVSKTFPDGRKVLDNVSLSIYRQEFFFILGPSGCGKTTLLRLLAGFERPDSGKIYVDHINVTETPPYQLPVNMVFQSYALFPHMTVEQNVGFQLRQARLPKRIITERVEEMLHLVHLTDCAHRKPNTLSGGQRQRVALARALANEPKVLLLDEPLGALDKSLREKTQFELVNIQEKVGATFVMVTHDQEEAMTMASRMGIMDHGQICQVGTPGEIYEYPNSLSVAQFVGSANIFEGVISHEDEEFAYVHCMDTEHPLAVGYTGATPVGMPVWVMVRPEKLAMSQRPFGKMTHNTAKGIVRDIGYLGDVSVYHIELTSGKMVMATQPNTVRLAERPVTWDSAVYLRWSPESSLIVTR